MEDCEMNEYESIIQIGDILVSGDVVTEFFCCDYEKCKGCCCVIGDSGAPLEESEIEEIERDYDKFSPLMEEAGKKAAEASGFFAVDRDGDLVTPTVPGLPGYEECAYAAFEGDRNCFCAIERCFFAGKCSFRKPISCWLYPIRVTDLGEGRVALNLHRWPICKDAFEKGKKEGVRVYEFLREPLVSAYGEEFYSALSEAAKRLNAAS